MSAIDETQEQYFTRKIKAIVETIEGAKNAGALVHFETKDTVTPLPMGNTPTIVITVIINEQVFKKWQDKK